MLETQMKEHNLRNADGQEESKNWVTSFLDIPPIFLETPLKTASQSLPCAFLSKL